MFNLQTTHQGPKITIDQGIACNGEYTYTKGSDSSKIKIIKEETNDLAYKVSVTYEGIKDQRPDWTIHINDKRPMIEKDGLIFSGSKEFVFKPIGKETIEIQETDENATAPIWIDISDERYEVCTTLPIVSEKIQALIQKARIFKPADEKVIKKIFYNNQVGVFLYAKDESHKTDIYHAKETEEFVKCESMMTSQCRCIVGDSTWSVKIPHEAESRNLTFPQSNFESKDGHGKNVSWDHIRMKSITLP